MNTTRRRSTTLYTAAGVVLFMVTFLAAYAGLTPAAVVSLAWAEPGIEPRYTPSMKTEAGSELAFIYIGSSGCDPSNWEPLYGMVEELKLLARDRAFDNGRSFTAMGIARDWEVEDGIAHLRKFGRFDEIMTGRNWLNAGLLKYVWEDIPGRAATPQIVVVDRRIVDQQMPDAADGLIRDERLVIRKVGTEEIQKWLQQGAPIPILHPVQVAASSRGP